MKLLEVKQSEEWWFTFTLILNDNFDEWDASKVVEQIQAMGIPGDYEVQAETTDDFGEYSIEYAVLFNSFPAAREAKKHLRRLSRGRPKFQITDAQISTWDEKRGWVVRK